MKKIYSRTFQGPVGRVLFTKHKNESYIESIAMQLMIADKKIRNAARR